MSRTTKPDRIEIHRTFDKTPQFRWTRFSGANGKIIGASTEGYTAKRGAVYNIARTQRAPYVVAYDGEVVQVPSLDD